MENFKEYFHKKLNEWQSAIPMVYDGKGSISRLEKIEDLDAAIEYNKYMADSAKRSLSKDAGYRERGTMNMYLDNIDKLKEEKKRRKKLKIEI